MVAEECIQELDEHISIETPEHIEFTFELAGLGTRFLAVLIDHLLQGLVLSVLAIAGVAFEVSAQLAWTQATAWVVGALVLLAFLIIWGYFVFFEASSNGQTPGKRIAGIRVVHDDGTPITFFDAVIRNLVRFVDSLPVYYTIGLVSLFVSPQNKRLGDYAAGTIVVKERATPIPEMTTTPPEEAYAPSPRSSPQLAAALRNVIGRLTPEELQVAERVVARRMELDPQARLNLARKIASRLMSKLALSGIPATPDEILEAIVEIAAERHSAV